MVKVFQINLTN